MSQKFEYTRINLVKFIGAFLVVAIHTHPFFNISWKLDFFCVNIVARIAVPFYLITSGFFLSSKIIYFSKISNQIKVKAYLLKLFQLYVLWSIIYLVIDYKAYFFNRPIIIGIIHVIRNFLFTSIDAHLWYLLANVIGIIVIIYVFKKLNWKGLISIIVLCFLLLLVTQTYARLIEGTPLATVIALYEKVFGGIANSFVMTIPFLTLGIAIHHFDIRQRVKYPGIVSMIAFIGMIIEHWTLKVLNLSADYAVSISLIVFSVFFFVYLLKQESKYQSPRLLKYSTLLQQGSLFIYIIHIAFLRLFLQIYQQVGIDNPRLFTFFAVSIASFISYLVLKRNKVLYQWLMCPNWKINRNKSMKRGYIND